MCQVFHTVCIYVFYKANNDVKEQPISVDLNVSSGRAWLKLISVYLKSKKRFAFSPAVVDQQTGKLNSIFKVTGISGEEK